MCFLAAVRADRMRGGRNKFGPMYKRDRARKLQVMRQRQLALQALRNSMGPDIKPTPISPGYQQAYPNMNIKQEIQIPQVSDAIRIVFLNNTFGRFDCFHRCHRFGIQLIFKIYGIQPIVMNEFLLISSGILTHPISGLVAQPHSNCVGTGEREHGRCYSHAHERRHWRQWGRWSERTKFRGQRQ